MERPRRRLVLLLATPVLLGLALALAVALSALGARSDLERAESQLQAVRRAFQSADGAAALEAMATAERHADAAAAAMSGPHVRAAAAVPWLGNSLDVTRGVAVESARLTRAARPVIESLRLDQEGLDRLRPAEGRLPVAVLAELADPLAGLRAEVEHATAALERSPTTWLLSSVADARARFLSLVRSLGHEVGVAADLTAALPAFLGGDAPRRYFLAVANPAEVRAVGGYLGAYAIVTIDDGDVDVGRFAPTWELPSLPPGRVPPPDPSFAARYDRYNATGLWANINMTPDFPTAATAIERLWQATRGESLDGVILVDPFALEALLRLSGPVEVAETGARLTPATVVDYVTNTSFEELGDPRERKEVIGDVAGASLEAFLAGDLRVPARRLVSVLGEVVGRRHLLLHSADSGVQAAFETAGVAGQLPDPPKGIFSAVTYNSGTASKVDYWLDEELDHAVRLLEDGRAEVRLTVTLRNGAPTEGVGRVVGPNAPGLEAGDNRLLVSVYCSTRCEFVAAEGPPEARDVGVAEELGQAVASSWVTVPSGETRTLVYTYVLDDAWEVVDGGLVVTFDHHDQTLVRPGRFRLALEVPTGFAAADHPDDARVSGGQIVWDRLGVGDVDLEFRLAASRSGESGRSS